VLVRTYIIGQLDAATNPTPIEDMKVPRKANVRIEPKLRKKFSWVSGSEDIVSRGKTLYLLKFITRVQDDWW
jgi:hypothetical protein